MHHNLLASSFSFFSFFSLGLLRGIRGINPGGGASPPLLRLGLRLSIAARRAASSASRSSCVIFASAFASSSRMRSRSLSFSRSFSRSLSSSSFSRCRRAASLSLLIFASSSFSRFTRASSSSLFSLAFLPFLRTSPSSSSLSSSSLPDSSTRTLGLRPRFLPGYVRVASFSPSSSMSLRLPPSPIGVEKCPFRPLRTPSKNPSSISSSSPTTTKLLRRQLSFLPFSSRI
mmetsp:Transcript_71840/g.105271  ORF Transcript_71840/g.105271 Transcript_71840/m.105271 type:complete len:230 (-) Transcript_71840:40-729(-)